jgi:hypothetical protein
MRILIKLVVLALAGYGGYSLYEKYGNRIPALRGPAQEFGDRVTSAAHDAGDTLSGSVSQAAGAVKDVAAETRRAATDAATAASQALTEDDETTSNETS